MNMHPHLAAATPDTAPPPPGRVASLLTIVIKTLNDGKNIETTLDSVLQASLGLDVEVVLADSLSNDNTTALSSAYPVHAVQLVHAGERCCGIGPLLGFQNARGEFIYLMDGEIQLRPGFWVRALSFMQHHTEMSGVGGCVRELNS